MKKIKASEFYLKVNNINKVSETQKIQIILPNGNKRFLNYWWSEQKAPIADVLIQRDKIIIENSINSRNNFYYFDAPGEIIVSNDLCKLLKQTKTEIDSNRALDFIFFGERPACKSIWANVGLIVPGTTLLIDFSAEKINLSVIGGLLATSSRHCDIFSLIKSVISEDCRDCDGIIVEFSGGLDSTSLLYAANQISIETNRKLLSATWTADQCSSNNDVRYASEIARNLSIEHAIFSIDPQLLFNVLSPGNLPDRPSVSICFGQYRENFLKQAIEKIGVQAPLIVNGHGGDHLFYDYPTVHILKDAFQDKGIGLFFKKAVELSSYRRVGLPSIIKEYFQRESAIDNFENPYIDKLVKSEFLSVYPDIPHAVDNGKEYRDQNIEQALCENKNSQNFFKSCSMSFPFTSQEVISCARSIPTYNLFDSTHNRLIFRQQMFEKCNSNIFFRRTKGHVTGAFQKALFTKKGKIRELIYDGYLSRKGMLNAQNLERTLQSSSLGYGGIPYQFLKIIAFELFVRSWKICLSER